jgi:hypothetical protein
LTESMNRPMAAQIVDFVRQIVPFRGILSATRFRMR